MVFNDATIPFVLMPHFISPGQLRRVKHAVSRLSKVLDRFCDAYPHDAALRDELAVSPEEDSLIRIDPGYPRPMRICRLDAFLIGYDLKFLEFNADSPAGIGYTDILYEGLTTAIDLPRVRQEFDTAYTPMLPELIGTLTDAYAHVRTRHTDLPERPTLALIDAEGSPAVPEFRIICAAARAAGLEATHATLDDLTYDGSKLTVKGEPVQLVYRRALLEDLDQSDLVAAARDGRVCVVNPFRARVANNKKLFALFGDPRFAHLIQGDEADVDQGDDPVDARPAARPHELRRLADRPAAVRRRQPRAPRAQAGVRLWRPQRLARHRDAAGALGGDRRRPTPSARTSSCRSTCPCPRRCSRRSRTATSRCASSASTSTPSASEAVMPARSPVSRTGPSST